MKEGEREGRGGCGCVDELGECGVLCYAIVSY